MNTAAAISTSRHAVQHTQAKVLTDIYRDDVNLAVWQRQLDSALQSEIKQLLSRKPGFQLALSLSPEQAEQQLLDAFGEKTSYLLLSRDIANLVDMFCCLFELKRAGLRLTVLDRAMCPKFHVDKVPCRLVSTFAGRASEWLEHSKVERSKLGAGSRGLADEDSGLFKQQDDIQRLTSGDVALLKGERWLGNEGAGLVHRSPALGTDEQRLLLTLDFSE
ncbi:DUF1826 domain-containing protein [Agaribacterium haliotis]|uniref:DUF1826 domain-containing protein n=1 Tax=Agaribacterium haliotis TaxID=2013869 RepID=UPI000BB57D33|nr:DUF1826 domain-containing protein [Agaribacterium haliotis]